MSRAVAKMTSLPEYLKDRLQFSNSSSDSGNSSPLKAPVSEKQEEDLKVSELQSILLNLPLFKTLGDKKSRILELYLSLFLLDLGNINWPS